MNGSPTGAILFGLGLVAGIAIGSATAVSALTQGAPDVLQSWSGVAMPDAPQVRARGLGWSTERQL